MPHDRSDLLNHSPPGQNSAALLTEGVRLFNARQWYACHDAFETLWRAEPTPLRDVYKGILQIAAGLFHAGRGNTKGARRLFLRAATLLALHGNASCRNLPLNVQPLLLWVQQAAGLPDAIPSTTIAPTLYLCQRAKTVR